MRAAPETFTLARRRAQPSAVFITRLTLTAGFAYLVALLVPGTSRPVLSPLTALLVVQVTLAQTIRNAVQRVVSVVAGVLVAAVLATITGFTWWSLMGVIAAALIIGQVLHLGEHVLEVPISAMLVLSINTGAAATSRITETLIGAGAGLVGGLLFAPVRVQPAEEAIIDLSGQLGSLLEQMAADLAGDAGPGSAGERLAQARASTRQVQRVDRALAEADESLRFNPRARPIPHAGIALRDGLETLERSVITARAIARALADLGGLDSGNPVEQEEIRNYLAVVLRQLAGAVRAFGRLVRADIGAGPGGSDRTRPVEDELRARLSDARHSQDRLAGLLRADRDTSLPSWSLRGELLTNLDRLRNELRVEHRARARERWPRRRPARSRQLAPRRLRPHRPAARRHSAGRRQG